MDSFNTKSKIETPVNFREAYPLKRRVIYSILSILSAIILAGFWNYHLVDGFGKNIIAGNTIGDTSALAGQFSSLGFDFGMIFAAVAGLAATFTACNCVVFAMIPGLACSVDEETNVGTPWQTFRCFVYGVLGVTAFYGFYIGLLGPEGVELINERAIRLGQAQAVFSALGVLMLIWGLLEMGLLDRIKKRFTVKTREFLSQSNVKALILGLFVGLFAVGRPFPVFREFLLYAASATNPLYGALVMMIQGIGQIALMAILFFLVIAFWRERIGILAAEKPYKLRLVSGIALLTGGMFFLYYWGFAFMLDIGRWGFKLGWY